MSIITTSYYMSIVVYQIHYYIIIISLPRRYYIIITSISQKAKLCNNDFIITYNYIACFYYTYIIPLLPIIAVITYYYVFETGQLAAVACVP